MAHETTRSLTLLIVSSSASLSSRSERLGDFIAGLLRNDYAPIESLKIRTLPPAALLKADVEDPGIASAVKLVEAADLIVFITPTYKGSYTGLLKTFIDLLPQYALKGKIVLPIATGGTIAHVQMLDNSLRPVLQTMWPLHIAQGCFVLDKHIDVDEGGRVNLIEDGANLLVSVVDQFEFVASALHAAKSSPSQ